MDQIVEGLELKAWMCIHFVSDIESLKPLRESVM